MKKIIIASNKYLFCLDGYQKLASKYWCESEGFTVLALKDPQVKLPKNYSLNILGPGFDDSTPWPATLLPYFRSISDDFFFLCFEDHFLVSNVNTALMNEAKQIMTTDKSISKVRLLPEYRGRNIPEEEEYSSNFKILNENRCYHNKSSFASLRPSIWRTSTFIDMLSSDDRIKTPHDFEEINIEDTNIYNRKFLIPKGTYPLYPDLDAFRSGKFHNKVMTQGPIADWWGKGNDAFTLNDEDKAIFIEARDLHRTNR